MAVAIDPTSDQVAPLLARRRRARARHRRPVARHRGERYRRQRSARPSAVRVQRHGAGNDVQRHARSPTRSPAPAARTSCRRRRQRHARRRRRRRHDDRRRRQRHLRRRQRRRRGRRSAGEGTDTVQSSVTYTLGANVENLTLTGSADINGTGNATTRLTGNSGINVLTAAPATTRSTAAPAPTRMTGGAGNDTYIVDNAGDVVIGARRRAAPTRCSQLGHLHARRQRREPDADRHAPTSTAPATRCANIAHRQQRQQHRSTAAPAPTRMTGGAGNDTYVVDNAGDVVTETPARAPTRCSASVTYTLGANVENLTLTGTGNINGTGNALRQHASPATPAANTPRRRRRAPTRMTGGAGNDTYVVDNAGDVGDRDRRRRHRHGADRRSPTRSAPTSRT